MSSKPKTFQTKLKRLIYDNHLEAKDLIPFSVQVDTDGFGLGQHHVYLIQNDRCNPTARTIILLCKTLSKMLNKKVTPNDILDYE
jgi:hypothetical protein